MTPLLSIVIPTKDRYEYLVVLLRSLLGFRRAPFEVVVTDNSADNTSYRRWAAGVEDSRLRYRYHAEPMSLIENCDSGIAAAQGTYVCMLGDDDGVTEWILDVVEWMHARQIDAAITNTPTYHWPGVQTRVLGSGGRGMLALRGPGRTARPLDTRRELRRVLSIGGTNMELLPRVYQGIVRRSCVEEVRRVCGTAFPGPSPDMANGVALCPFVSTLYLIDFPVIIAGHSPRSGGGRGSMGGHVGVLTDQPHLPKDTATAWTPYVPMFWSGPTIWAESAVRALRVTGEEAPGKFGYGYLYAACLVFHWRYRKAVARAIRTLVGDQPLRQLWCYTAVLWYVGVVWGARAVSLVRNIAIKLRVPPFLQVKELETIGDAIDYLHRRYRTAPKPWEANDSP